MNDEIIEEVWKSKEDIATRGTSDLEKLAEYIKSEADTLYPDRVVVNLKEKKTA